MLRQPAATPDTLGQLPTPSGFAWIVATGDVAGGRYVSNLYSLTVFDGTSVPEPASLTLLAVVGVTTLCVGH